MKNIIKVSMSLCLAVLTAACSHTAPAPAAPAPMPPPTKEQMDAAFKKASTPTAEHVLLKQLEGNWKVSTQFFMSPDAPPQVTAGWAKNTMTLDGKFLREEFSGKFMNQPFKGTGYTGFDTILGQFNSVWMDSMSTAMMATSGSYNPGDKTITSGGAMSCPFTNGKIGVRTVIHLTDKDHHSFEMYVTGPDGKEVKNLDIFYTRAKK